MYQEEPPGQIEKLLPPVEKSDLVIELDNSKIKTPKTVPVKENKIELILNMY